MADWKEILSDNEEQVTDEELLKYLDENTSEGEKHAIEKKISETSFESDAIEGLQKISKPVQVQQHVRQLNRALHKQLSNRRQKKDKGKVINFRWVLLTILILLFICVIGYVLIRMHNNRAVSKTQTSGVSKQHK